MVEKEACYTNQMIAREANKSIYLNYIGKHFSKINDFFKESQ